MLLRALVACIALGACTSLPRQSENLEREARNFMAGYARDLLAGDRDAIVGRYDPNGAYMVGRGAKTFASAEEIRVRYGQPSWRAPARFQWCDLSFEVTGPSTILVTGRFEWSPPAGPILLGSYTSLLARGDRGLRIRVEHEDFAAADGPTPPCSP